MYQARRRFRSCLCQMPLPQMQSTYFQYLPHCTDCIRSTEYEAIPKTDSKENMSYIWGRLTKHMNWAVYSKTPSSAQECSRRIHTYIYIYIDSPWYTLLYCFKLPHVSLQMWNHQYPPSKLETIAAPDHFFGSGLASSRNFWSASMPGRHHKRCQFALSECHLVKQIGLSCFVQAKDYSLELHCLPQPLNNENGPQSCWVSRNWPLKFSHFSRVNLLGFSPSMVTVRIRHDGAMTDAV